MSQNLLSSSFILSGPPDPVTGCQVKNKTFTTISIGCRQGYDGGLKQYFVAILCPYHTFSEVLEDTKESNLVLPDKLKCKREIGSQRNFNEPSFLFEHLPHGSQFSLAIFAQNIKVRTYSFNTIYLSRAFQNIQEMESVIFVPKLVLVFLREIVAFKLSIEETTQFL